VTLYVLAFSLECDGISTGSGAASGGRGEASPYGWTSKIINMFVLSLSWNFFVSHDKYIARPSSHVDAQTIRPGLGDFVL